MVGHCAGMVDLVALPVWMGALIARYACCRSRPACW
jgi:hypothetical protein